MVQRYINFSKEAQVDQFEEATRIVSLGTGSPPRIQEGDPIALIERLKPLASRGKERAWAGFLDGLKGLFAAAPEIQAMNGKRTARD